MRDLKTCLSVAPILSTIWFGSLGGFLIENNRFFPGCVDVPLFFILDIGVGRNKEY